MHTSGLRKNSGLSGEEDLTGQGPSIRLASEGRTDRRGPQAMGDPDQMQCTARRESDREGRLQAGRAKGRLKTERPRSPWATVRVGEAECTDQPAEHCSVAN